MLIKGPKQTRFLISNSIYSKLIPENHFLRKLDEYIDWSRLEAVILPLYCEDNGRPVTNVPRRMLKAEVLQFLYDWTDREIVDHAQYNIVVKWFLELTIDEEPFDFTALSKFRVKLGEKLHRELFDALLDTTQLIQKMCAHVQKKLERAGYTLPATAEEKKKETLQDAVKKASSLIETTSDISEIQNEREMLKSVLEDYTEYDERGEAKERKQKGSGRLVSVTDPDVRWGAKSDKKMWAGYKAHLMMDENRTITSVTVTSGNVTDDKEALPLYDQQEDNPVTVTGDGLYGTGENRRAFNERGCHLIAPLRGQENCTSLFPKSKFSWDGEKVTCPAGKTTDKFTDNKRSRCYVFRFRGKDCQGCRLKPQCTPGHYRTISISYYQKEFDEAEKFNSTPEYTAHMKKRASIEPKNAEMKNSHGLARARYRGLERVTIQALLTAIAVNLKNFIRLLKKAAKSAAQRKLSISNG